MTCDVGNSHDSGNIDKLELNAIKGVVELTGNTIEIEPKYESNDISASISISKKGRDNFISNDTECLFTQKDATSLQDAICPKLLVSGENVNGNDNVSNCNVGLAPQINDAGGIIFVKQDEARNEPSEKVNPDLKMFEECVTSLVNEEGDKSGNDLSVKTGRNYEKQNEGNLNNIKENADFHENVQQKVESLDSEIDSNSESDESELKISETASKCDNTDFVTEDGQAKRIKKRRENEKLKMKGIDAKNIQDDSLQTNKGENESTITVSKRKDTDIGSEAEHKNRCIKDREFLSPEATKEDKSEKKNDNNGKVFGIAKSWETSQSTPDTVMETAPKDSTLFASSTSNSTSNQLGPNGRIKAMEGTTDDTLSLHEENKDEDLSNSGTEADSRKESDAGEKTPKDSEDVAEGKSKGNQSQSLVGTDVDTGRMSRRQRKNWKKKNKNKMRKQQNNVIMIF